MRVILGIVTILVLLVLGLVVLLYSGVADVAALKPSSPLATWVADTAKRQSVRAHARGIEVPPMGQPEQVEEGAKLYASECVACHGAPGTPPNPVTRAMRPPPSDLTESVRAWTSAELFWITKNGLAFSGMPGWGEARVDAELWPIVAFLNQLPTMDAARWQALTAPPAPPPAPEQPAAETDVVPPSEGEPPAEPAPEPAPAEPLPEQAPGQ